MTERKSPGKRRAKTPALFLNPLFDEKPSPAKLAVWTGCLHEKDFGAMDTARLRALASLPSGELFEDRAERIRRKIASWDRDKLEAYYVHTLLSALLLRSSQRMMGEMLPLLSAMAERQAGHEELHETARTLALYANMLFNQELPRRRGYRHGGGSTASQKGRKPSAAMINGCRTPTNLPPAEVTHATSLERLRKSMASRLVPYGKALRKPGNERHKSAANKTDAGRAHIRFGVLNLHYGRRGVSNHEDSSCFKSFAGPNCSSAWA